ncbi:MAG: BPTI/Kunitz-type proteinase inhibitor domain-containing protein [Candidatus Marinimicrobia bacterium]|nr:BPTI/Kunitz-type proteinase inhibitor domain-containing protein [Candidatus Neomarinimicrobiota bacterium]
MNSVKKLNPKIFIILVGFIACEPEKPDQLPMECYLKPETGPCDAYFPRYYYDQKEGECKEFIWGGCQGVVPFETMEECKRSCSE